MAGSKIEKEDSISIKMTIDEDWKGFDLRLDSTIKMDSEDIILAIECWLRDNILHGYEYNTRNPN